MHVISKNDYKLLKETKTLTELCEWINTKGHGFSNVSLTVIDRAVIKRVKELLISTIEESKDAEGIYALYNVYLPAIDNSKKENLVMSTFIKMYSVTGKIPYSLNCAMERWNVVC